MTRANFSPMNDNVLVVGAGTMGAGIALVAAHGGYSVTLVEPDAGARERGLARLQKDAERFSAPQLLDNVAMVDRLPERSDAALAIEAIPERTDLKRQLFAQLSRILPENALLATNTSSLSVGEIATAASHPERVLGLHFFNPPAAMKLVEIVAAGETSDEALEIARRFVERVGKTSVLTADTPGFIVNRVARPFYLQAMRALERGVASIEELDALARSAGFRMGPFELMDLIGLDVNLATSESVYERLEAARLEPVGLQRKLVAEGRLGRKSGVGFYDYRSGDPGRMGLSVNAEDRERNEDEVVAIVGTVADQFAELLDRHYAHVVRIENDDLLAETDADATIVIDAGDGAGDRSAVLAQIDSLFGPETIVFADAYATDLAHAARSMSHPERLVGYGLLGAWEDQRAIEIVDPAGASDDALELAQEMFESLGKGVVLVENRPGLFLGRVVGSLVNEAVIAVNDNVASAQDVDLAMRLGVNYPIGPIEWGREIGGARISRILRRLADAEGEAFAPHRSLWVLDVEEEAEAEPVEMPVERPILG
jgi:3-hydroxybutyryl-CoA dehydrogenase